MNRSAPTDAAFRWVVIAGAIFVLLTVVAMLIYPGGRVGDADSRGYAFFANFFSDLGKPGRMAATTTGHR